ncbi:MAG: hypothetical protein AAFY88_23220 [Acidobacteriota bacterium]
MSGWFEDAVTRLMEVELFGLSGGPLAAVVFISFCALLLIYAGVYRALRRRELERLMPRLDFQPVDSPDPAQLVPEELFYPNGFTSQQLEAGYASLLPRISQAWSGRIAGHRALVMDVSITRTRGRRTSKSFDGTVIRCAPPGDAPPDFKITEWVLFKGQIRGQRAIAGPAEMGQHYYLFSDAPDEALEPWVTPTLRSQLERFRLWDIAVHGGVFFLAQGNARLRPDDFPQFLAEAESLLAGLTAAAGRDRQAL